MTDSKTDFLGLRTVVYYVEDLEAAKQWYVDALGITPYFDTPFYVGFNVGGFELGLHPAESKPVLPGSSVAYWGVANIENQWNRLIELGATPHSNIEEVGGGIKVAALLDPFGNLLGIIENPHFPNDATSDSNSD